MPEAVYVLTFPIDGPLTPEDRCMLKEQLASVVRETLVISAPVAIDQHETDR